jgi:ABC-type uncharacterized transport system YnjBCD permease subunit
MRKIQNTLLVVVVIALMLTVVPFALAQDQPPQPPQPLPPEQPPVDPDVDVNVNAPWGTILLIAIGALLLVALVGLASRGTDTYRVEHVEDHHHHRDSA